MKTKAKILNAITGILLIINLVMLGVFDKNPSWENYLRGTGIALLLLFASSGIVESISILRNEPNYDTFLRINWGPKFPATNHGIALLWLVIYSLLFIIIATFVLVRAFGVTI